MQLVLFVYLIYWRKARKYRRNLHPIIRLKTYYIYIYIYIYIYKSSQFIDIFENNYNIVLDPFKINSVKVMKNMSLLVKKHKENVIVYQLGAVTSVNHGNFHQEQQHSKRLSAVLVCGKPLRNLMTWKIIGLMLLVIYNDVIKSS